MVQHMAPVTPHGPDVEQNRFVLARRPLERFLGPRIPMHGLVRGRAQIRARFVCQAVFAHDSPFIVNRARSLPGLPSLHSLPSLPTLNRLDPFDWENRDDW